LKREQKWENWAEKMVMENRRGYKIQAIGRCRMRRRRRNSVLSVIEQNERVWSYEFAFEKGGGLDRLDHEILFAREA
jgi:hypothetical protein